MSRIIATNEIKEEFDGVLETPLANSPFGFDVSPESFHELQAAEVHCPNSSTAFINSSSQLPRENDDQNCATKSNTASDDSMTEDEEEDNATDKDRDDLKIKVGYLNCTELGCGDKLNTLDQLYEHLRNKHELSPLLCFCGCKSRFDNRRQIALHLRDRSVSKFSCASCSKVFNTQAQTNRHWYRYHLTGQFQCNIDDCSKVADIRNRIRAHQQRKHCPESKRVQCPHCSSSFVFNKDLKRHQVIHLNTKPFHCKWPKCVHRTNYRSCLIKHIRNKHFKKQQEKGIAGERDPNKYIQVAKK